MVVVVTTVMSVFCCLWPIMKHLAIFLWETVSSRVDGILLFPENLEFLHTDVIVRWCNYADVLQMKKIPTERSSIIGKFK